ncbi:MAG: ATP-binding protein [Sulfurimonas sp.]|uniref:PAS domain-containing sensor histidine kinase n=1 Tax=Sulfurimonas sp. TaxID=2022749 RepID=UPI002633E583|nr:ATP-binding protein [Sulfurimonas sp.]MDD5400918.1 ATP-binding protein [Sulfurimonas sp.]
MQENNSEILLTPKAQLKQNIKKNNPDFRYYKALFNITENLVVITDGDTIMDANKAFVDFFAAQDIDIFDQNFFFPSVFQKIDKYGYIYDGYQNKRWFEHIHKKDRDYYRVGIIGINRLHEFNISIKQFELSQNVFIVIMTDISEIMGYKNTLEYNLRSVSKNKEETQFLLNQYNNAINISNLVVKIDINGNITYANDAFCKTLKHTQEELIGQNIKILCNKNETYRYYSSIIQTINNGEVHKGIIENVDREGESHFFNTTIVPIKNQQGIIIEYLSIQDEITDTVKTKEEAVQALEAKGKFFDKVSHELRTPLNAIINFTDQALEMYDEILDDKESRELVKLYLQRANVNSKNLLNLINSLLDISKLKSTKEHFNIGIHDVVKLVKESYESCSSLNTKENVDYRLKIDFISGLIICDNFKFNQILINLISNAFKFTKEGFVSIHLSVVGDEYWIEVEDSGIGIPNEKLSRIFEPFEQARSNDIGTGLGLSIVREYVNAMKIALEVTSSEGVGSCFRLKAKKIITKE